MRWQRPWAPKLLAVILFSLCGNTGCRSKQHAHVVADNKADMVGSHAAGAETYKPLVAEATSRLLGRHHVGVQPVSHAAQGPHALRVCFVGVENRSAEAIGDFKEQIYQQVDSILLQSPVYQPINKRFVDAGLRELRMRPDELFLPRNRRAFAAVLEEQGQPFDFLLYAQVTSGTTRSNKDYQRDYVLSLEMVNIHTGAYDKESASLRKGYHKSVLGKIKQYGF